MDSLYDSSENCCVCGRDVSKRSPLFVNRVPELNDYITKLDMGRKFPRGEWVCIICDNSDSDDVLHNLEDIEFSFKVSDEIIRLAEDIYATRRERNGYGRSS